MTRARGEIREKGNKEEEWWFLFRSIGSLPPFYQKRKSHRWAADRREPQVWLQTEWLTTSKTVPLAEQKMYMYMLGPSREIYR